MIAVLKGLLLHKEPNRAIIDASGVGYCALIPVSTYIKLGEVGSPIELFIHTYLADDSINLYGFATSEEKETFLKLIQISGIGPKLAMNILSGISPADLEEAVKAGDVSRISLIPGIGKKTALRLAMELQDKFKEKERILSIGPQSKETDDLLSALQNMGFRRKEVEQVVREVVSSNKKKANFDHLLRECLKRLAKI